MNQFMKDRSASDRMIAILSSLADRCGETSSADTASSGTARNATLRLARTLSIVLVVVGMALSASGQGEPPNGPPPGGRGSSGRGGPVRGGAPRSAPYTLSGAYTLNGGTAKIEYQSYRSATNDVSAIFVQNGGDLALINPTVTTTGNSSSTENSSFYGLNAAVLATQGSKVTIVGGSVTTSGTGANGVFAAGRGAAISLSQVTIRATGDGAHGVMATAGGSLTLDKVNIKTSRARAAAIATDRGGGTITATGGSFTTSGSGSPGIYSTGNIAASNATFNATGSEAAVIEGRNSINLTDCTLSSGGRCGVMIYQSFSGDAPGKQGTFIMNGGSLTADIGPLFYVTNTRGVITLKGVKATANSGTLVDARSGRWGSSGSNGGNAVFVADGETLIGNLSCDRISSITVTLQNGTTLTGSIKGAALTMDSTSKWNVTEDSLLTRLSNPMGISGGTITNIYGNGHEIHYSASLSANHWLGGKTYALDGGGHLLPGQ